MFNFVVYNMLSTTILSENLAGIYFWIGWKICLFRLMDKLAGIWWIPEIVALGWNLFCW